jgi:hypothetical protein
MGEIRFFAGLDLGQAQDFTALAIIDRVELVGDWDPVVFAWKKVVKLQLRYLDRMPLGMPYPDVVERTRQTLRSPMLDGERQLIVDGTGVGRPVIDLLRRAELGCGIVAVTITGGDAEGQSDGYHRVPKRDLIVGLQLAMQKGDIQIAAGLEHGPTLVRELSDLQVKVTPSGNSVYGAWREGQHDDLVLAFAMAYWGALKGSKRESGYWQRHVWATNMHSFARMGRNK